MPEPNWPSSWTRAALELCVLSVVGETENTHGYDVARRLQSSGLGDIKGGTLYPVLSRLEEQGLTRTWWVEGAGGPGRKLIAITPEGQQALEIRASQWRDWSSRVERLLTAARAPGRTTGNPAALVNSGPGGPAFDPTPSGRPESDPDRRPVAAQADSTTS